MDDEATWTSVARAARAEGVVDTWVSSAMALLESLARHSSARTRDARRTLEATVLLGPKRGGALGAMGEVAIHGADRKSVV